MAGAPDTLPANFFDGKEPPDTLPPDFFGSSSNVIPINSKRKRNTLTGRETPSKPISGQIADLIEGTAKVSSGALFPAAILAPGATALGAAGAAALGYGGKKAAQALGATDDQARLVGDVAGVAGGAAGSKYGTQAARAAGEVVSDVAPRLGAGAKVLVERLPGAGVVKKVGSAFADARQAMQSPPKPFGPTANRPESNSGPTPGQYNTPLPAGPQPINARSLPEGVNRPVQAGSSPEAVGNRITALNNPWEPTPQRPATDYSGYKPSSQRPSSSQYGAPPPKPPAHPNERNVSPPTAVAPSPVDVAKHADAMIKVLGKTGISAADAAKMTDTEWRLVASVAGMKEPPSPEAIEMTIGTMGSPAAASDPPTLRGRAAAYKGTSSVKEWPKPRRRR